MDPVAKNLADKPEEDQTDQSIQQEKLALPLDDLFVSTPDPVGEDVADEANDQQGTQKENIHPCVDGRDDNSESLVRISWLYDLPFLPEKCLPGNSVWNFNISNLMDSLTNIIASYPFIAVQTRYIHDPDQEPVPPTMAKTPDEAYANVVENLDNVLLVQIAFTFADAAGNRFRVAGDPRDFLMQFNFKFSGSVEELDAEDRVEMEDVRGVNILMHVTKGIDIVTMALFLWSTGPIMNDNIRWVSYDAAHDFASLLRIVRATTQCGVLPESRSRFLELVGLYFPTIYDVKHLAESRELRGGSLRETAKEAGIVEVDENWEDGKPEVMLTMEIFRELCSAFPGGVVPEEHANVIGGLGQRSRP